MAGKSKTINRLSDKAIEGLKPKLNEKTGKPSPNKVHDGGGLYIVVSPTGNKSFVVRYTFDGKPREDGIGAFRDKIDGKLTSGIRLAEARAVATEYRVLVSKGIDPRQALRGEKPSSEASGAAQVEKIEVKTFGLVVEEYIETFKAEWRNPKHHQQWENTLRTYCATIWERDVASIGFADVKGILAPIWTMKAETASRLRGRIEAVLSYAATSGWRDGANPATWSGNLENVLPKRQKLQRGAMKAMPYADVPAFYQRLCEAKGRDALALRFTILNASRSGEVRLAVWSEIDWKQKLWIIPGERMKRPEVFENKLLPHVVPLSDEAMTILKLRKSANEEGDLIFPGAKKGKPLSDMTLTAAMRRWDLPYHVHGFRSSFRDWAGATTHTPFDVIEKALAHAVGSAVTRAYFRDPLIDKRRRLMNEWATYLTTRP